MTNTTIENTAIQVKLNMDSEGELVTLDYEVFTTGYRAPIQFGALRISDIDIEEKCWDNFDEYLYQSNEHYRKLATFINCSIREAFDMHSFYEVLKYLLGFNSQITLIAGGNK
jgi:hypothetical protein